MRKLFRFVLSALTEPIYAGAPSGHNNRVLFARLAVVLGVASAAAVLVLIGVELASFAPEMDGSFLLTLAVGFAGGLLTGWFLRRLPQRSLSRGLNPTVPSPRPEADSGTERGATA